MNAKTYNGIDITIELNSKVLIVNVASFCGLTQCEYTDLYELCIKNPELTVYCFPSNQFLNQEHSNANDAHKWVTDNFGIMPKNMVFMELTNVNYFSSECHPIYKYLIRNTKILGLPIPIKWNFEKFLIINGNIERYGPTTKSSSLLNKI